MKTFEQKNILNRKIFRFFHLAASLQLFRPYKFNQTLLQRLGLTVFGFVRSMDSNSQ